VDPDDGKDWRADGSISVSISATSCCPPASWNAGGARLGRQPDPVDQCAPIPSVTLERNYTDPFKPDGLSWIGPWRASIAMGGPNPTVAVTDVRFFAARVNFRPRPGWSSA
jgi:hypothetical protein